MAEDPTIHAAERDPLHDLGRVAGELVHDLSNDVQVLQGWAALARGEAELGRLPQSELERVARLADNLGSMLRDVLASLADQRISPEVGFDPATLTETVVNDRIHDLAPAVVQFRSDLPRGIRVSGAPSFWARIIANLLRNAGRHARRRVTVSLTLHTAEEGRELVVLRIEDDGPGVPVEARESIFRPLYKGQSGGTGLGLSSVAWAVEKLRGQVSYATDSALGGAAFDVRVPAVRQRNGIEADAATEEATVSGMKLVVVDDDASVRFALSRLLRRAGADVREVDPVGQPEETLVAELLSALPDLVLMDLRLGERGGTALWKRMKREIPYLADRVLFISGSGPGDSLWEEAANSGQPILGKPFQLGELVRALDDLRPGR